MKQEINPKNTSRAQAFELWMKSPMPMVTLVKTLDVTRLRKYAKRYSMPFNMAKAGFTVHVLSDCITSYDLKKLPEMLAYYESKGCEVKTLGDYKQ